MERCSFDVCKKKITIMKFECKFCHKHYCVTHQLPETHVCDIHNSDAYENYKNSTAEYRATIDKDKIRFDKNRAHNNNDW